MKSLSRKRSNDGVTALETIIVITLIGLIMGFLIIRMAGVSDQKMIQIVKGDLRSLQTAIHAYYLNHDQMYPSGADWQNDDLVSDSPRVLRQVLYDVFQGPTSEYNYSTSTDGKYYVVFSNGPDRIADITGIDTNGKLMGQNDDDIFMTNGDGSFA